jgi:hypothetical protein
MSRHGETVNDANQQALLGATDVYGDVWNRQLAARNQPLNEYGNIMDIVGGSMPDFLSAPELQNTDILNDQRATEAAKSASKSNKTSGLLGLAGKLLPLIL